MGRCLGTTLALGALTVVAGCGQATAPQADGRVEATPRALAAVLLEHVPLEPRRTSGTWSEANDPLQIEAQVDFGVDPEGSEEGETRTVRVDVAEIAAYPGEERGFLRCQPEELEGGQQRCEEKAVGEGMLVYRWEAGAEEEAPGTYSWILVREDEVARVTYEGSGQFDEDPRGLGLGVAPRLLRAAALDPAMSLRTAPELVDAGRALDYEGMETPPPPRALRPTTPEELASAVVDYLGIEPVSVARSKLDDFGPDAVGAHLEFAAAKRYDAFALDILTTVGRVRQIDPLPCPVQRAGAAARARCFAWDADTVALWTLADGTRPGVLWMIGAQDDDKTNRVETVGVKVVSRAIDRPFFTDPGTRMRIPENLLALGPMTGDLTLGPDVRVSTG